jgi:hypothetical protein
VNQKIGNLCLATEKTNTLLESQAKVKRLELAITYVHIGSFPYIQWGSHNRNASVSNSQVVVRGILHHFVLGLGCDLPADHYVGDPIIMYTTDSKSKRFEASRRLGEMQVLFREKIVQQIKDLIGQEPRLVDDGDRKFTILPPL